MKVVGILTYVRGINNSYNREEMNKMNKTIINVGATLLIMVVGTTLIKSMISAEKVFDKLVELQKKKEEA